MLSNPTPAGDFRHRITIKRRYVAGANQIGEQQAWELSEPSPRWAKVEVLTADERQHAAENRMDITHRVRLRYTTAVTHADAVLFRGRTLHVQGIINVEEASGELVLLCREEA